MIFFSLSTNIFFTLSISLGLITGLFSNPVTGHREAIDVLGEGAFSVQPTPTPFDVDENPNFSIVENSLSVETQSPPVLDLDYVSFRYHSWDIPEEANLDSAFWVDIDLTNQMLFAYRGNQLINGFRISSGTANHKTITGTYKIFSTYPSITMTGPGYDLPDVPFSMFIYKGYAIHGTYWHNNFGTPMSHGCVNMNTADAAWIYANAPVGTYVTVHY